MPHAENSWRYTRILLRACVVAAVLVPSWPAAAQSPAERLATCFACHGEKGRSTLPEVPSLGAQQTFYLSIQMYMFRERLRAVEPMNAVLKGVSDDDLKAMAELINKLPAPISPEGNTDPARMDQGRTLGAQNRCNICHRSDYHGEQNVPRLAGQREDYLLKALREYKANTRRGYDAAMADVLTSVSDEQIRDLAYYLSRLR